MTQRTARVVAVDENGIQEAARQVLSGGIVAYPTDTVYGLGCDPFNERAVDRLIRAKERARGALPILVNSMTAAKKLGDFNKGSLRLVGRFWPGPLTLIVPLRDKLPRALTDNSSFVGLRIPKHETALNLIEQCGGFLIGTSANISGHPPIISLKEVTEELGNRVDLVLDGGPSPSGKESTVAKVIGGGVEILRVGAISQDEILKALKTG